MAVIKNDNSYMEFPLQISRQYGAPIDKYSVFYDLSSAETYASSNPLSYVGQIITVVNETNESATVYLIKDKSGNLEKVGDSSMMFVADETAMLGIEGTIQTGQQVYREDTHTVWIFKGGDKTQIANWTESSQSMTKWENTDDLVGFYALTKEEYDAIGSKDNKVLYFITDIGKVYKGSTDVTSAVESVQSFDEEGGISLDNAVEGKLYVCLDNNNKNDGCRIKTNNEWVNITPGYYTDGFNWAQADSDKFATIGLIKKGIAEAIGSKIDSMGAGEADVVVTATATGGIQRTSTKIGSSTISDTANENTLATEAAVKNVLSWDSING